MPVWTIKKNQRIIKIGHVNYWLDQLVKEIFIILNRIFD